MKKVFKQLKITLSVIVIFALLLGCGAFTYQRANRIISDFSRKDDVLDYLSQDIYDYYNFGGKTRDDGSIGGYDPDSEKGIGILPAFYLSHEDNHYNTNYIGFYSMLQNSDGEIVAKYQPYILFEKDLNDKRKDDVRVLVLGDEFSEEYYLGEIETEKEKYNFNARDELEDITAYGIEKENRGGMKVDGTCDDELVYLEKLTWQRSINSQTTIYTYSPKEKQIAKGSVNFESWLDYKNNDVYISVSEDVRYLYVSGPEYIQEAKELCEQNLDAYKNNQSLKHDFSKDLFTTTAQISSIIGDENSDNYYIFTAAYVIHPLKVAVQTLVPEFLIALAIGVGWIVFINVLLNRKKRLLESSYVLKEINNTAERGLKL